MNLIKQLQDRYQQLWKNIIQPHRQIYQNQDLGSQLLFIKGTTVKRTDIQLYNKRGLKLQCSVYSPETITSNSPCVIYLHGISSSRLEGYQVVNYLLPNISLFVFDFSGSGQSEGDYVTLGYYEKDDLDCIVQYINENLHTNKIALWGRSMGAVTAIIYASQNIQKISTVILDSPFSNYKNVIKEVAQQMTQLPIIIIDAIFYIIEKKIQDILNVNIFDIDILNAASTITIPGYFAHSKEDKIVKEYHVERLYEAFKGQKIRQFIKGQHNSVREESFYLEVQKHLYQVFNLANQFNIHEIKSIPYRGLGLLSQSTQKTDITKQDCLKRVNTQQNEYEQNYQAKPFSLEVEINRDYNNHQYQIDKNFSTTRHINSNNSKGKNFEQLFNIQENFVCKSYCQQTKNSEEQQQSSKLQYNKLIKQNKDKQSPQQKSNINASIINTAANIGNNKKIFQFNNYNSTKSDIPETLKDNNSNIFDRQHIIDRYKIQQKNDRSKQQNNSISRIYQNTSEIKQKENSIQVPNSINAHINLVSKNQKNNNQLFKIDNPKPRSGYHKIFSENIPNKNFKFSDEIN